ncbi:branched-chain amino acid transport system permease protein LivM [Pseudonocardia sp. N23]|nr:branched-chain amino acid transport system permease protein LivM [Pseudonocardia sp. N23]
MRSKRTRQWGGVLVVGVVLFVLAAFVPENRVLLLNAFLAYGALVVGLDLLVGDLRMMPAGHAAFFGAGGYATVLLYQKAGLPLPVAGALAVLIVAALAALIGLPAVGRSSGFSFAIITFAFGELLIQLIANVPGFFGGSSGLTIDWGVGSDMPFDFSVYRYFSLWLVGVLVVVMLVVVAVRNSHLGLRMKAVRADENGTRGLGFNPTTYKAIAFVLASMLAGLVGVFWAPMNGFISPDTLGVNQSILLLGMLIIGGVGRITGALVGVVLLVTLPAMFDVDPVLRTVLVGLLLAIVALLQPAGIVGGLAKLWTRLRRPKTPPPADGPVDAALEPAGAGR